MSSKKVFTKMDLRWEFNNIRIKEGDKWKGAFMTHVGSFEPIVISFGMTNLPAIFQAMMNKILRDLINEGKVAAFVNNVGTETEEGYCKGITHWQPLIILSMSSESELKKE